MRAIGLAKSLSSLGQDALSFALPRHCPGCDRIVEARTLLCETCEVRLENLRQSPCCRFCASPIPDDLGPCGRCNDKSLSPFKAIARLTTFESITRDLVLSIKYGHRWSILPWIASQLVRQPRVRECLAASDVIVPVPLHWTRRFGRGFNQAELLACELGKLAGLNVVCAVRRTQMTRPQTAFHSRQARRHNLRGAFRLSHSKSLEGKRILIVDDVMTSGATLQAMARAIKLGCKPGCRPRELRAVVIATANPLKTDLAM